MYRDCANVSAAHAAGADALSMLDARMSYVVPKLNRAVHTTWQRKDSQSQSKSKLDSFEQTD